ncbi:MAG: NAD-dependent epimerase/dehydratase family protein [Bacillota bacterium]
MRILVTGGAGFIGAHVVEELLKEGAQVSIVDNLSTGCMDKVPPGAAFYRVDITAPSAREVVETERPEAIMHLAAQPVAPRSLEDPFFDATVNVLGTLNLLEAARKSGVRRFIYASSAAVYGDPVYLPVDETHPVQPLSPYGVSKYTAEVYVTAFRRLYGLEGVVLRLANVYGPGQDTVGEGGVVAIFCRRLFTGKPLEVFGDGEQTRDFIYVKDVVWALTAALKRGAGETLNIGTGAATSINELVQALNDISGKVAVPRYCSPRPGDIRHSVLNPQKAREVLAWNPVFNLPAGLRETFATLTEDRSAQHST